jgi:hypothetical protein
MLNRVVEQTFGAHVELGHWLITSAKPRGRSCWSQAVTNPSRSCSSRTSQAFGQRRTTLDRNGAVARALLDGLVNHERRLLNKERTHGSKTAFRFAQRVTKRGESTSGEGVPCEAS